MRISSSIKLINYLDENGEFAYLPPHYDIGDVDAYADMTADMATNADVVAEVVMDANERMNHRIMYQNEYKKRHPNAKDVSRQE